MKKIYYNGTIIAGNDFHYEEAVCTEDEKIICFGKYGNISEKFPDAVKVNLEGNIIMPSFIDPHSHLSSYALSFLQVSLEDALSFDDINQKLKDYIKENNIKKGEWVTAVAYDHNVLKEKKHPQKEILDKEFPENPIVLRHKSEHFGVFNSLGLKEIGITEESSKDDKFVKFDEGYLEENAFISAIKKVPLPDFKKLQDAYKKAQLKYASYGITTVQEGMIAKELIPIYEGLLNSNSFMLDVVGYAGIEDAEKIYGVFSENINEYNNNFRLGGYKIFLDGSPQGRTAWMRTPYMNSSNEFGNPTMNDEDVKNAVLKAAVSKRQLLAHCNGDAASDQFIKAVDSISKEYDVAEIRPVIVHAQLIGIDQLDDVKRLSLIPSFFVAHVYHWGDVHIENFGFERASYISPLKSALDKGILFTLHQDTPVIKPDMFETIWCASNRITKNGVKLNEKETITVKEALKAVTINAAYQYGEEDLKGSIDIGKYADFIIVDKNPLEIAREEIKNIKIIETIRKGNTIYKS